MHQSLNDARLCCKGRMHHSHSRLLGCLQSVAETMTIVRQAMKSDIRQLLKFDSDDFIDDAIYMEQQAVAAGRRSWQ